MGQEKNLKEPHQSQPTSKGSPQLSLTKACQVSMGISQGEHVNETKRTSGLN